MEAEFLKKFYSRQKGTITFGAAVLHFSNATPFKPRVGNGFQCYFQCPTEYTPEVIRAHSNAAHRIHRLRIASGREDNIIKVDIEALKCTICSTPMADLEEFENHLTREHEKKLRKDFCDVVVPFKLSSRSFSCQLCGKAYDEFQLLNHHMHSHYRHHICEVCGDGFITRKWLNRHRLAHTGEYACEACKKSFTSPLNLRNHIDRVHENKHKLVCPKCPERFKDYYRKLKHLAEVHDAAPPNFPCESCAKVFSHKCSLRAHTRSEHLRERPHACGTCELKFFTAAQMRLHAIKHTGEKSFQCGVCKKSYARVKTLREHMKIHDNVRKFVCGACGQAFVQNCSLKGHIKTHHSDIKGST